MGGFLCTNIASKSCNRKKKPPQGPLNAYWQHFTVQIFSVADVLEVAARILPAKLRLWPIGLQSGVVVPPVFGARRHAAGRCIPHGEIRLMLVVGHNF